MNTAAKAFRLPGHIVLAEPKLRFGSPDARDIDIHPIPAAKGEPDHFHFDIRYLARTSAPNAIALDANEDSRHLAAGSQHNFGYRRQTDSRIAQLPFENEVNLLAKRLYPPLALMFRSAWLYHEKLP